MTRRQRTTLFSVASAIFLVVSPIIVLYAVGFRIDVASHRLVKTGGLSLTASPQPVNAYIDGQLESSNNFIFRNIFISNLLPRNYTIKLTKDGYYSWQKTLPVEEGQVTEALSITLYPKIPRSATLAPKTDSLFASPDGSRILFTQNSAAGETLLLKNGQSEAVVVKTLAQGEIIQQIIFAQDNSVFLVLEKINGAVHLLSGNASATPVTLQDVSSFIPAAVLSHIAANSTQFSSDGNLLYILSAPSASVQGIYVLHLDTHVFAGLLQPNVNGFLTVSDGVYLMSSAGILSKCSSDLTSCDQVSSARLTLPGTGFSTLSTDGDHLALLQAKNLYVYQPDDQTFTFVTDGVQAIFFSPDKQKIAIEKDHEVSVYWLKDIVRGEQHKLGDLTLLLRISEKISGVAWLTDPYQYLAVESPDALRIVELDGRDTRNIVSYPQFSSSQQIFWQKDSTNLVLLHGKTFLQDFVQAIAQ